MRNNQYGLIGQDNNPTGFTNNFLESRNYSNLFNEKYKDYSINTNELRATTGNEYSNILTNIIEDSKVSRIFFSMNNINHIKKLLCSIIKRRANYDISPESQSTKEIITVMRSIYLQNSKNMDTKINEQIIELNYAVLLDLYPRTLNNIKHYLTYIRSHGTHPIPMERPRNVHITGTKTLNGIPNKFI
jgi:hypothetical protein